MKRFVAKLYRDAAKTPKRIVFPEATESRVLEAIKEIIKKKIALPILIGNTTNIKNALKKHKIIENKIVIVDPTKSKNYPFYVEKFISIRKTHGKKISKRNAETLLLEPIYFGTMMVQSCHADGLISGVAHPTAHTLRPAFQIIGTHKKFHKASGVFFMVLEKRLLLFADCCVNIAPDAKDLAEIALDTAKTARMMGFTPKVAMLSFSTHGSAEHYFVDKVREATSIARSMNKGLIIDGEIQVDAAIIPTIAKRKCPQSLLKGEANILIFPNLDVGNIAYKLVERLAHANAIGPIIQGLAKPINDMSRGCSARDIVEVAAVTVLQAQGKITY